MDVIRCIALGLWIAAEHLIGLGIVIAVPVVLALASAEMLEGWAR